MRLLYLHADNFGYKTVKPALKNPPDPPGEASFGEALVVFATVEDGDGPGAVESAASDIALHSSRLKVGLVVIYPYAHLSSRLAKPRTAHRMLVELERALREKFSGEIHRAPFGWYKSFTISCKGHPLAELSRSFTETEPDEPWPAASDLTKGVSGEVLSRTGLSGGGSLSPASWSIDVHKHLAEEAMGPVENLGFGESLGEAYSACISSQTSIIVLGPKPPSMVFGPIETDPREAVSRILAIISPQLKEERPTLEEDPGGFVKALTQEGERLPIAVAREGRVCLGPTLSLFKLAVSLLVRRARDEGVTPYLNPSITPVQSAVIPVEPDNESYALKVARDLVALGLRVSLVKGGGLGRRVREAGRSWASLIVVTGRREEETGTVVVRRRWEPGKQEVLTLEEFCLKLES
ncbi:threonyl-tRNA synthetase editing domain-containing protein [Aeropyrum camini]|uniref:threonyl-tRNA synthetase editing domain-containing protein n=1 Tax=Aeropyrum camini TaxID=229980 RepID=UPI0007869BB5|nr:threonyl-tRNA synthetase editing domain-containing protein [Aeropyrum camini]